MVEGGVTPTWDVPYWALEDGTEQKYLFFLAAQLTTVQLPADPSTSPDRATCGGWMGVQ